jgi:hypothetical protein
MRTLLTLAILLLAIGTAHAEKPKLHSSLVDTWCGGEKHDGWEQYTRCKSIESMILDADGNYRWLEGACKVRTLAVLGIVPRDVEIAEAAAAG